MRKFSLLISSFVVVAILGYGFLRKPWCYSDKVGSLFVDIIEKPSLVMEDGWVRGGLRCIHIEPDDDRSGRFLWLQLGMGWELGYKLPEREYILGNDAQNSSSVVELVRYFRSDKLKEHFRRWQKTLPLSRPPSGETDSGSHP